MSWVARTRSQIAVGVLVLAAAVLAAPAAEAREELLRWSYPDGAIDGFHVLVGTASRSYDTTLDVGIPARTADGAYQVTISVADDATIYAAIAAYDVEGQSPLSNERMRVPEVAVPAAVAPPVLLD